MGEGCKIIVVVLLIVIVILGIWCWKKCEKTRYVAVVPTKDLGKCTTWPNPRSMGEEGIKWVTFINFTDNDVNIKFLDSDAIEGSATQTLPPDEPVKLKLKDPVTEKTYEYVIVGGCTYEGPPTGPRVVIP